MTPNKVPLKAAINVSQQINKCAAELTALIRAAGELGIQVQIEVQDELRMGFDFGTPIITATARIDPNRLEVPTDRIQDTPAAMPMPPYNKII